MAGAERRVGARCGRRTTHFDPDALAGRDHARAPASLLLNSPHNPTGKVFSVAELELIAELCRRARPDRDHRRGLRAPGLRRRARPARRRSRACASARVTISSAGKTFSFTGLEDRLGLRAAGAGHRGADRQAVPHLRERRAVPVRDRDRARVCRTTTSRRSPKTCAADATSLSDGLADAGFRVFPSAGTYFVTTDIRPLGEERRAGVLPRRSPSAAAWSPCRTSSSTTTRKPAGRSSGSRSASDPRCSRRPFTGWRGSGADASYLSMRSTTRSVCTCCS